MQSFCEEFIGRLDLFDRFAGFKQNVNSSVHRFRETSLMLIDEHFNYIRDEQ